MKTKIISNIDKLKEDVYLMSFRRDFDFVPGQVLGITTSSKIHPRLYSIASGIDDEYVKILFDVKEEGELSPRLAELKKGSSILSSLPAGNFICKEENAYWIAAGTGIAPFASMLYSGIGRGKTLIHGGRTLDSFYFENDFRKTLGDSYIPCCSKEKSENVFNGRITDYLRSRDKLPVNRKYYLCGSAEMVIETRDVLLSKDIPYNNIVAEIYF